MTGVPMAAWVKTGKLVWTHKSEDCKVFRHGIGNWRFRLRTSTQSNGPFGSKEQAMSAAIAAMSPDSREPAPKKDPLSPMKFQGNELIVLGLGLATANVLDQQEAQAKLRGKLARGIHERFGQEGLDASRLTKYLDK